MKNGKLLASASACILFLAATALFYNAGRRPFKDLDAADIRSATVRLSPPDKTIRIDDISELAEYLEDVVIYREGPSYTEYEEQGVLFTLERADGARTEAVAYNPFFIIDGVGYRTKYEPCQVLNSYANWLLNDEDSVVILEEPPALSVISGRTSHGALLDAYSWQRRDQDGSIVGTEADSPHPLDCRDLLPVLETTEGAAILLFSEEPDALLSARCWNDSHWADLSTKSEAVTVNGDQIALKLGGYLYEIAAKWDTNNGYGGIVRYSFYCKHVS